MTAGDAAMVVVGAGQAGGRAVLTLREAGHTGTIVLLGSESSAPYERPPLSKAFLKGERTVDTFTFATREALSAAGIDFRPATTVTAIDRRQRTVSLADGSTLPYAKCLLATGREPRRLPVAPGLEGVVHVLRDLRDAETLRARLVPGRPSRRHRRRLHRARGCGERAGARRRRDRDRDPAAPAQPIRAGADRRPPRPPPRRRRRRDRPRRSD